MSDSCPIFIGGAGRSGTTLVVDMLGLHPHISPIYETDFVLQLIDLLFSEKRLLFNDLGSTVTACMDQWTLPLPQRPHTKREHERYHHGPHYILFERAFALARTTEFAAAVNRGETESGFRQFLSALFAEHCRMDNKPRWANKTPAYVNNLPTLQRLFPTMRFIHCIRDGRDVACSAMTRHWGPRSLPEAAAWWATKVQDGVEFARQFPDQCLEVRYEEFVLQPEQSLDRVFRWLGEEGCSEGILRRYQNGDVTLDHERIGEWEREFSLADCDAFEQQAGELLEHFGYRRKQCGQKIMESENASATASIQSRDSVRQELSQLIAMCVSLPRGSDELNDDLPLGADGIGLDSIAVVELLVACEKRWGRPFPAELLEQMPLTVGKLIEHLQGTRNS